MCISISAVAFSSSCESVYMMTCLVRDNESSSVFDVRYNDVLLRLLDRLSHLHRQLLIFLSIPISVVIGSSYINRGQNISGYTKCRHIQLYRSGKPYSSALDSLISRLPLVFYRAEVPFMSQYIYKYICTCILKFKFCVINYIFKQHGFLLNIPSRWEQDFNG